MRVTIAALGHAMASVAHVFVLLFLVMLVFAIIGLQLFSGSMHQRCFDFVPTVFNISDPTPDPDTTPGSWVLDVNNTRLCTPPGDGFSTSSFGCSPLQRCLSRVGQLLVTVVSL